MCCRQGCTKVATRGWYGKPYEKVVFETIEGANHGNPVFSYVVVVSMVAGLLTEKIIDKTKEIANESYVRLIFA